MFSIVIRTAFRQFRRFSLYSGLNLFGLAFGIAAAFTLMVYTWQELTYDRHFRDADRIYRVATDFFEMGGFAKSQPALHEALRAEFKDVKTATRFDRAFQETDVLVDGRHFREPDLYYIDSSFFQVFSYEWIEGDAGRRLANNEVLLMEPVARKYFGRERAWGKTLQIGGSDDRREYQVAGVIRQPHGRSHLQPAMFLSIYPRLKPNERWTAASVYNYVKLNEAGSAAGLEAGLADLLERRVYPASGSDQPFEQWSAGSHAVRFFVQPLTDIYLHSDYMFETSPGGNPQLVYILALIGLFIISISAINYINLTTARSSLRAREVGVKKAMGAGREALVGQFLLESVLFSLLAMALATGMMELLLQVFQRITGEPLTYGGFFQVRYLVPFLIFSLLVGLLAGLYPAFYLTSFRPVQILKGEETRRSNRRLRGGLVVVQFTIAVALMVSSLVVYSQLRYMRDKDLGFEQEGVFILDNYGILGDQAGAFREALAARAEVEGTSVAGRLPAGNSVWMYTYQTPQMPESVTIQTFPVDENYLPTLGLRLVEGRNFSREIDRDSTRQPVILNEAAVEALGLHENPIDAEVNPGQRVIGIVSDFNYQSLRERIAPAILIHTDEAYNLLVRLRGNRMADFLAGLPALWERFGAREPLRYHFLDENFATLAAGERLLSQAVAFFTLLAVLIACLGLFGLATLTAEQRTKEIGIRKVLGANVRQLVGLLTRDFLLLIGVALAAGLPLAWYAGRRWLENFAFSVEMQWWMFAAPAAGALLVALLTVSVQALRAARRNPVESLRYE